MQRLEWFVRLLWVRSSPAPAATMLGWLLVASLSLAYAVWNPDLGDYDFVRAWLHYWNLGDANPYREAGLLVDYPPHAFIVLWPMTWLPQGSSPLFALVNLVLHLSAACLLVKGFARLSAAPVSVIETGALVAMVMATRYVHGSVRHGQTMPLSVGLFMMALLLAERRPWLAGLALGLASFKLNLAVGFVLAFSALGLWTPLLVGGAVAAAMSALFAWTVEAPLTQLVMDYARNLGSIYYPPGDPMTGVSSMRTVFRAFIQPESLAYVLFAGLCVGTLILLLDSVRRSGRSPRLRAVAFMACVLWSFVALPQQTFNLVLLLPVIWLLVWPETRLIETTWVRQVVSGAALCYVIIPLPQGSNPSPSGLELVWLLRARFVVFGFFCFLVYHLRRPSLRPTTAAS